MLAIIISRNGSNDDDDYDENDDDDDQDDEDDEDNDDDDDERSTLEDLSRAHKMVHIRGFLALKKS